MRNLNDYLSARLAVENCVPGFSMVIDPDIRGVLLITPEVELLYLREADVADADTFGAVVKQAVMRWIG